MDRLPKDGYSQAELVRKIKASGAAPSIWQPHVSVLRELERQLVSAQSINGSVNDEASAATSNGLQELNPEVARLEAEIAKQVCMTGMSSRVEQNVVRYL